MTNKLADALSCLDMAKTYAKLAGKALTAHHESDEASMKTLAVLDAIDLARAEVELRGRANEKT